MPRRGSWWRRSGTFGSPWTIAGRLNCVDGRCRACSRWLRRWLRVRATAPSPSDDGAEAASLRNRAAFADTILERLDAMTPAERRQFDRLMKGDVPTR